MSKKKPYTSEKVLQYLRYISDAETDEVGKQFLSFIIDKENLATFSFSKEFPRYPALANCHSSFYYRTIEEMIRHILSMEVEDDLREFLLITHIVSFRRFRAAYSLLIKGYYSECLALSRGLFENVLILIALKNDHLNLSEARPLPDNNELKNKEDFIEVEGNLKKKFDYVSRIFKEKLIDKSEKLSKESVNDIRSYLFGMHNAVHRSNFALWQAYSHTHSGNSLGIEPDFSKKYAFQTWNLFWFTAACLNKTLNWFPFILNDKTFLEWKKKHAMTCELFEDFLETNTAPIFTGLKEFYMKTLE